uniref:Uncharacterized protein n=1 Tax=viral metagenome TaxID=1070528 RepID=A0A6C0APG0_9ZZZZ
MEDEDIKWANAAELGHMTQQIELTEEIQLRISEFLKIANEENYNKKLKKLKEYLSEIPNCELFCNNLKNIIIIEKIEWQRWFPIEQTPLTHYLHASYLRIVPKYLFRNDPQIGLPVPDIFYRRENILGSNEKYQIGKLTTFYYIIKPFGYKFPDLIESDSMRFVLFDISNPKYLMLSRPDSKYKGAPMPIYKNGKSCHIMSDKEYMAAYKKYIYNSQL